MGDAEHKKALQSEMVAVKTRWSDEVKLSKAKDSPTAPFPVTLQRTIPKPEAASAFDVEELRLQLLVASSDRATMPISVQVAGELPPTVQKRIAAHVEARWREEIEARGAAPGWMLEKILGWAEGAYADLLWLEPTYVEQYEGCDDAGMTIRRYAIAEPPEAKEEASEEEAAASEEEEEEESSEDEEVARQRRIKEKAEAEADRQWREERRREHEALGEEGRQPQGVSKKEQQRLIEEKRAKKQGHRTAKTGQKAHKADATANGAKKNGKNSLLH